ncbi:MAG: hypothetical protein KGK07_16210, partial [Chloroflexota bacterium]|nr:hypothetical protein [Chloroflexota bacterium]
KAQSKAARAARLRHAAAKRRKAWSDYSRSKKARRAAAKGVLIVRLTGKNKKARAAAIRAKHPGRKIKFIGLYRKKRKKTMAKKKRAASKRKKTYSRKGKKHYRRKGKVHHRRKGRKHARRHVRQHRLTALGRRIARSHAKKGRVKRSKKTGRFSKRGRTAGLIVRESRRRGAFENPLSGMELGVGLAAGVVGYALAQGVSLYFARRDNVFTAGGPPGATAFDVPLWHQPVRLGVGVALAVVPLVGAHFVSGPKLRSALQFAGFAAGLFVAGKLVTDAAAKFLPDNQIVRDYLPGQLATQNALATIPASKGGTGAGALPAGVGCRSCGSSHLPAQPVAGGLPAPAAGQVTTPTMSTQTAAPPPAYNPPAHTERRQALPPRTPATARPSFAPAVPGAVVSQIAQQPVASVMGSQVAVAGLPAGVGAPVSKRPFNYRWANNHEG